MIHYWTTRWESNPRKMVHSHSAFPIWHTGGDGVSGFEPELSASKADVVDRYTILQ
jgi:hypothetical protein